MPITVFTVHASFLRPNSPETIFTQPQKAVKIAGKMWFQPVVAVINLKPIEHLDEVNMQLVALPFKPNNAEYLALLNSRRIRGDQMEFLRGQFSKNSRLLAH
jgi:hypothetical protein